MIIYQRIRIQMDRRRLLCVLMAIVAALVGLLTTSATAQSGSKQNPQTGASASGGSSAGISFPRSDWQSKLGSMPDVKGHTFLCYRLISLDSASQPYRFIPATSTLESQSGKIVPCTVVDKDHPVLMDTKVVLAVDLRLFPDDLSEEPILLDTQRIAELILNVQVTAGSPGSANPVRGAANAGTTYNLGQTPKTLFLEWPYPIPGDNIPTLSVTVLYDPPKPGNNWQKSTLYPPGSVISAVTGTGTSEIPRYLQVDHEIQSGEIPPDWTSIRDPQPSDGGTDGDCAWTWIGTVGSTLAQAYQQKEKPWLPKATYAVGDVIQGPGSLQLFIANKNNGATTPAQSPSPTCQTGNRWLSTWNKGTGVTDQIHLQLTEPPVTSDGDPSNGGVLWVLNPLKSDSCNASSAWQHKTYDSYGQICVPSAHKPPKWYSIAQAGTSGLKQPSFNETGLSWRMVNPDTSCLVGAAAPGWAANTEYGASSKICVRSHVYVAQNKEYSGKDSPFYESDDYAWYDIGPTPPATVTGTLASEQSLQSLPTISLPQSHTLYSFNVSSGVLVTNLRTKSFGFAPSAASVTTNSGTAIQTGSSLLIDPVISLTRYFVPFDAAHKWQFKNLTPGLTLSFSLTSPSNNFYIGGSSEFTRYIQLEYGYALARLPQLAPGVFVPQSSTTPTTVSKFQSGVYIGLAFNFTSLIPGGGSGSGSSSKSGGSSSGGASGSN